MSKLWQPREKFLFYLYFIGLNKNAISAHSLNVFRSLYYLVSVFSSPILFFFRAMVRLVYCTNCMFIEKLIQ